MDTASAPLPQYLGQAEEILVNAIAGLSQREVELVDLAHLREGPFASAAVVTDQADDIAMRVAGLRDQLTQAATCVGASQRAEHDGPRSEAMLAAQRLLLQAKVAVRGAEAQLRSAVAGAEADPVLTAASLHQVREARERAYGAHEMIELAGHDPSDRWVQEPEQWEVRQDRSTRATSFRPDAPGQVSATGPAHRR